MAQLWCFVSPSRPSPQELENGARVYLGGLAAAKRFLTSNEQNLRWALDARGEAEAGPKGYDGRPTRYVLPVLPEGSPRAGRDVHTVVMNRLLSLDKGTNELRFRGRGQGRKTHTKHSGQVSGGEGNRGTAVEGRSGAQGGFAP